MFRSGPSSTSLKIKLVITPECSQNDAADGYREVEPVITLAVWVAICGPPIAHLRAKEVRHGGKLSSNYPRGGEIGSSPSRGLSPERRHRLSDITSTPNGL
jgi:hypothetical protein